jgi:tetratricopeptide (TPR) repeat protein
MVLVCLLLVAPSAAAERLLDRQPFDEITLTQAGGGQVLKVAPLDLPGRRLPATPPAGDLTVELLDDPRQAYTVSWSDIAQIRLFESMLLAEAQRLSAAGQFDEAYDYFARLLSEYPSLAGLDEAVGDYLRRNSLALYEAKQYERALDLLATLYERDQKSPGLAKAVETVAGQIISQHLREQDYAAARAVLALWQRQFEQLDRSAVDDWERRFAAAAERQVDDAKALLEKRDFIAARQAAHQALTIWPELVEAHQLLAEIHRAYPSIVVGVFETSPRVPVRRLDCWAALRTGRLVQRTLVELVDFGAEGGIYRSPYGKLQLDDSGLRLSLTLGAAAVPAQHGRPWRSELSRRVRQPIGGRDR